MGGRATRAERGATPRGGYRRGQPCAMPQSRQGASPQGVSMEEPRRWAAGRGLMTRPTAFPGLPRACDGARARSGSKYFFAERAAGAAKWQAEVLWAAAAERIYTALHINPKPYGQRVYITPSQRFTAAKSREGL